MHLTQLFKKGYVFIVLGIAFLGLNLMPLYVLLPASSYWEIRRGPEPIINRIGAVLVGLRAAYLNLPLEIIDENGPI